MGMRQYETPKKNPKIKPHKIKMDIRRPTGANTNSSQICHGLPSFKAQPLDQKQ